MVSKAVERNKHAGIFVQLIHKTVIFHASTQFAVLTVSFALFPSVLGSGEVALSVTPSESVRARH